MCVVELAVCGVCEDFVCVVYLYHNISSTYLIEKMKSVKRREYEARDEVEME